MNVSRAKHVPIRMCVICGKRLPKCELTRYVCCADAQGLAEDTDKAHTGRGFYICDSEDCIKRLPKYQGWRRKCQGVKNDG